MNSQIFKEVYIFLIFRYKESNQRLYYRLCPSVVPNSAPFKWKCRLHLINCCWSIVLCDAHCLWWIYIGHCFDMHYFVFFLVKLSSKIFWLTVQGDASFVDHLCCFCLVLLCFHARLFVDALWSPAGGWPLGSRLWCVFVTLSLSHWCPGSGVVLDCINSWFLPSFLLWYYWRF